jgi:mannose-6-phosphate isomerase-like protein (cupin superfamily)
MQSGRIKALKRAAFTVLVFVLLCSWVHAQTQREPRKPSPPFVVLNSQSLDDLQRKLKPSNKAEDLIGGEGMQLRVAVQHEKDKATADGEVHDASDDVYYVLEGTATLVLGGHLDSPHEISPGEWRSPKIVEGRTVEISKGDVIIVPRGTPHQRTTAGKDFTMLLIKIFAEPLPPTDTPKPATEVRKP